jgi:hypothetical protein
LARARLTDETDEVDAPNATDAARDWRNDRATQEEIPMEPRRKFKNCSHDLWRYRELFYGLAWRDVAVR